MITVLTSVDLGRMWKEALVACFKVLSQHLPQGTEENHKKSDYVYDYDLLNRHNVKKTNCQ